jgi:hypothetical protein
MQPFRELVNKRVILIWLTFPCILSSSNSPFLPFFSHWTKYQVHEVFTPLQWPCCMTYVLHFLMLKRQVPMHFGVWLYVFAVQWSDHPSNTFYQMIKIFTASEVKLSLVLNQNLMLWRRMCCGDIAPRILKFNIRWRWVMSFSPGAFTHSPPPRLLDIQSQSGRSEGEEILCSCLESNLSYPAAIVSEFRPSFEPDQIRWIPW